MAWLSFGSLGHETMEAFWYFAFAVAFTLAFTVAICRWRTARGKKVSCGTMTAGAFSAAVCALIANMYLWGAELFSREFWQHLRESGSLSSLVPMLALTAMPCTLVALVVVVYYQAKGRRSQTDEKHVA